MNETYIKRKKYLNQIIPFIDKEIIKVITGQRRVGKSYLILQIIDLIKEKNKRANIVYINKESNDFNEIKNHQDLIKYVKKQSVNKKKTYLFIDEIQDIEQFEKALRHFNASGKYDIYCTGSNAKLLSSEIATYLSGRYIEIKVFSLSFIEFLEFHKLEKNQEALNKYIKYGGLPYLINMNLEEVPPIYTYLQNIYNTIILKDIVSRFNIRNINFLERLIEYISDNIGSIVSAKKISDFLKSQKISMSPNTVLNHLEYIASSFFIHKVKRLDVKGKKVFEIGEKYYFEDLGIRNAVFGYKTGDINKILENLVFNHLKFLGYSVYVGQMQDREIDFVAEKEGERIYIQTAYLIDSKKTEEREFGNLLKIKDSYPKMVVSTDMLTGKSYKGVQHINIIDFLQKDNL